MIGHPTPPAVLSKDGMYRYFLSRTLGFEGPVIAFIGLNPSTADAHKDDPTIRRCMSFAKLWGGRELWMVNLFAFRSTAPEALYSATDPVGPANDDWLTASISQADIVVAAWGNHGDLLERSSIIRARFRGKLQALRVTKTGMPGHPLYVAATTSLISFE